MSNAENMIGNEGKGRKRRKGKRSLMMADRKEGKRGAYQ